MSTLNSEHLILALFSTALWRIETGTAFGSKKHISTSRKKAVHPGFSIFCLVYDARLPFTPSWSTLAPLSSSQAAASLAHLSSNAYKKQKTFLLTFQQIHILKKAPARTFLGGDRQPHGSYYLAVWWKVDEFFEKLLKGGWGLGLHGLPWSAIICLGLP